MWPENGAMYIVWVTVCFAFFVSREVCRTSIQLPIPRFVAMTLLVHFPVHGMKEL